MTNPQGKDLYLAKQGFSYKIKLTEKRNNEAKTLEGEVDFGDILIVTGFDHSNDKLSIKLRQVYPPKDFNRLIILPVETLKESFFKIECSELVEVHERMQDTVELLDTLSNLRDQLKDMKESADTEFNVRNFKEFISSIGEAIKEFEEITEDTPTKPPEDSKEIKKGDLYKLVEQANTPFAIGTVWKVDRKSGEGMLLKLEDLNGSTLYYANKDGLYEFGDFRLKFEKVR